MQDFLRARVIVERRYEAKHGPYTPADGERDLEEEKIAETAASMEIRDNSGNQTSHQNADNLNCDS